MLVIINRLQWFHGKFPPFLSNHPTLGKYEFEKQNNQTELDKLV